ncbi:MAG: hypothetical protein EXS05_23815 [Planctomycetaceae bacterium]|nr:hypothetical protein [Planctomycetaceae bacterium]
MTEPWFDPNVYSWIPGTVLGCLAGVWGTLVGLLARKGRAKTLLVTIAFVLLGASALLLLAGIVALATGQPYAVWYGLGLAGLIGVLVLGINTPVMLHAYRQAEQRKLTAGDL